MFLGQSVTVAEEKAAAALDSQQLKLFAAGSTPFFIDLLFLFSLLLLFELCWIDRFGKSLRLLLANYDGLWSMSEVLKILLFETLGAHTSESLVSEKTFALNTHKITGLFGNLGLLFHIHQFNYNVVLTAIKAQ